MRKRRRAMSELQETLKATSNVIELKPGHKYLLVFKGDGVSYRDLDTTQNRLAEMGISSLSVLLGGDVELSVVEVPVER
jgi:hypothetical protein